MTQRDFSSDPKALLENVDGSLLTLLKEKLIQSRYWEKLARICENYEGKKVFSQTDINRMAHKPSPEEAFIEELLKRNVTVEYIISILKRAEMFDLLVIIGKEERAEIVNQSVTGLKEVKLDEKVKFTMDVTGIPLPSFQWYRGEDPIPESTSATHCINAFDVKDEGIYLCLVRQFLKEGDYLLWSSPIHLCVKEDAPSFLHGPERVVDIQEGQELLIRCAFDGYPWPTYSWVRDGEILTSGDVEPVFKIDNARLSDTGVYKCVARNYLGEAESNPVSVEVKTPKEKATMCPRLFVIPFYVRKNQKEQLVNH
ncbi:Contactin-5 [Armadillidium vulgare]|nr:Contactin-5 [Armadillidium vulgare]